MNIGISFGLDRLVVESNSVNEVKWTSRVKKTLWKLINVVREIKALLIDREISFSQVSRSANRVRFFAKQGVDSAFQGDYHL